MKITNLVLSNYRNYSNLNLSFDNKLNIIEGKNASVKTNLVEAIYFCGVGRSPRTTKDKELIKWDKDAARISLTLQKKYRSHRIDILLSQNGQKRIAVDGANILKMGELMGVLNIVFFSPDYIKMVKESPQERRNFLDISLCQQSKNYFYSLLKYNKILNHRNKLLKTSTSLTELSNTLPIWDTQLADEGARLVVARLNFINAIYPIARSFHSKITQNKEVLSLNYERAYSGDNFVDIRDSLLSKFSSNIEKEYSLGYTLFGVHRDDFSILSNDIHLRSFGSQGQQRTASLSIKLAETKYFEEITGETPLLILDDVFSELDDSRRKALLQATSNVQTLITCTDYKEKATANIITVANGSVV